MSERPARRIATGRCDAEDSTQVNWGPSGDCKAQTTMFDYYGVSQRVAAVRLSPWRWIQGQGGHYENHGDEFNESYTYGPVGVTTRTVETEDADPGGQLRSLGLAGCFWRHGRAFVV